MVNAITNHKRWIEWAGRLGYAARAVIYFTVGILALRTFFGYSGGKLTGSKEAIISLTDQPFAMSLLIAMAVGLVGYSVWRFIQAVWDADNHGQSFKAYCVRSGLFVSAITHGSLAYFTYKVIRGLAVSTNGDQKQVAWLMSLSYGRYIVMALGMILISFGLAQVAKAWKETYMKYLQVSQQRNLVHLIAKTGLSARAIAFVVLGGVFVWSGYTMKNQGGGGLDQFWQFLLQLNYGNYLVALMGVGFFVFGLYSAVEAWCRRIEPA